MSVSHRRALSVTNIGWTSFCLGRSSPFCCGVSGVCHGEGTSASFEGVGVVRVSKKAWKTALKPFFRQTVCGVRRSQRCLIISHAYLQLEEAFWRKRGRDFRWQGRGQAVWEAGCWTGTHIGQKRGGDCPVKKCLGPALTIDEKVELVKEHRRPPLKDIVDFVQTFNHLERTAWTSAVRRSCYPREPGSRPVSHLRCWGTNDQDQDAVYTSYDWLRTLLIDSKVRVSYSELGAKGNSWIESMWGRIKSDIGSLITEAETLEELKSIVNKRMQYYNCQRRHSSIDYQSPRSYLEHHFEGENAAAP